MDEPIEELNNGEITISVKDNSGNILTSKRNFHVGAEPAQASLEVTKVGLDQVNLNLTGEQSNQFMLESSNDLINWYPLLKILDFDGAQNFIYPIQPQTDKVFYRTNRIEK